MRKIKKIIIATRENVGSYEIGNTVNDLTINEIWEMKDQDGTVYACLDNKEKTIVEIKNQCPVVIEYYE